MSRITRTAAVFVAAALTAPSPAAATTSITRSARTIDDPPVPSDATAPVSSRTEAYTTTGEGKST